MIRIREASLATRMALQFGSLVFACLLVLSVVVTILARGMGQDYVLKDSQALAERSALETKLELDEPITAVKTLAKEFEAIAGTSAANRDVYNKLVQQVLSDNPSVNCVWAVFEPNAFDSKDATLANTECSNDIGRYIPMYDRADGTIRSSQNPESTLQPGSGDYYLLPKKAGKEMLIPPYKWVYRPGTPEFFLTSYSIPIYKGGQCIGVVGLDITLDRLAKTLGGIKPYGTGYANLIVNNGTFATHRDAGQLGKDIGGSAELEQVKTAITEGKQDEIYSYDKNLKTKVRTVYVPVNIGDSDTPWALAVTIPMDKALAPVTRLTTICIIVALLATIICMAFIVFIAGKVAAPIRLMGRVARHLSEGDVDSASDLMGNAA